MSKMRSHLEYSQQPTYLQVSRSTFYPRAALPLGSYRLDTAFAHLENAVSNPTKFLLKFTPCAEAVAASVAVDKGGVFYAVRKVNRQASARRASQSFRTTSYRRLVSFGQICR